jgi:hypothetical protein
MRLTAYKRRADVSESLLLFYLRGEQIACLVNQTQGAGHHSAILNTAQLPSGIYLAIFSSGSTFRAKQVLLRK